MTTSPKSRKAMLSLALFATFATVVVGILLRLVDPLSSPVVAAEDPYTHMALVRGHLLDGNLDPLFNGGNLYPPGLHAVLATVWVYTGADLYHIFRIGPVVMGALSVLGIATLLWRFEGMVAAVVGGLAVAVAPEMIFRTTMMAPTALDMVILPAFLFSALMTLRGRIAWSAVLVVLGGFLVTAHPWILAVMGPVVVGMVVLSMLFPAREPDRRASSVGMAALLLSMGAVLLLSISVCWDQCGLGFQNIDSPTFDTSLDKAVTAVAALCFLGGGALVVAKRPVERFLTRLSERPMPVWLRSVASVAIAAVVVGLTVPAVQNGMPMHVDLPRMFGWPILGLAAVGLVALPFLRTPATHAGAAVVAVTYPFVIHAPFSDPNWPHRTAVFMGIGLVLLAGVAAGALVRWAWHVSHHAVDRRGRQTSHTGRPLFVTASAAASLLVAVSLVGTVYAGTPDEYDGGWYRLYTDCEFDAMRELAEDADLNTVIVTGSWEAKLVMAAFAKNAENVWFSYELYSDEADRTDRLGQQAGEGKQVIMVVDRHLEGRHSDLDTSFLEQDPWTPVGSWCSGMGLEQPRLKAYRMEANA